MADHRGPCVALRERDGVHRLGQRPDLVDLDEHAVRGPLVDGAPDEGRVGDEQVVADELDTIAQARGEPAPARPVLLVEPVLDRHDRIAVHEVRPQLDHLIGRQHAALTLEVVGAVAVELAHRGVERDRHVLAGVVAGRTDGLDEQVERGGVGREVRSEAPLVPEAGREPATLQHGLEVVVDLGPHAQGLREARGTDGHDHELLHVDAGLRVAAAVEHVHARHREHVRVGAAEVGVQRQVRSRRCGLRRRERDTEHRVRAEVRAVVGAVEIDEPCVKPALVGRIVSGDGRRDRTVHVRDRRQHPLAEVALRVPVTQLDDLVRPRRCA